MQNSSLILSVVGGLNQTCLDKLLDIKIILIFLADVECCRSNRFNDFLRLGLREGVVGMDDYESI
jgi:hypothetical protein